MKNIKIFIGSSSEGLPLAQKAASMLEALNPSITSVLWNSSFFGINESAFATLIQKSILFDFAIFVASKDDLVESRKTQYSGIRDNIIFEFGLFLGRLGAKRTFLLVEDDAKIPSDLKGITLSYFKVDEENSLENKIVDLIHSINENIKLGLLGLLPSTALAVGYYDNFVKPISVSLFDNTKIINEETNIHHECNSVKIVLPSTLDSDVVEKSKMFIKKNKLIKASIGDNPRKRPIQYFQSVEDGIIIVYDMPTTLNALKKSIDIYMEKGYIGKSEIHKDLELRELDNFKSVLNHLIEENDITRSLVEVISDSDVSN